VSGVAIDLSVFKTEEPPELADLRTTLRKILDRHAPMEVVRSWDAAHTFPADLYQVLAEAGFIAMPFQEQYGGGGAGPEEMVVVAEELGRRGMDIAGGYGISVFVGLIIQNHGSERLRSEFLPGILAGERHLCVSITEPDAGSDVSGITTTAVPADDGGYRLQGQKVFTTSAGQPGATMAVVARTNR
jgi:alkylation response protein AidB-like acyl-CoA dehydrogenase